MRSRWRSIVRFFHPEAIPGFVTRFYNLVSGTGLFQRHYDLVAADMASYCAKGKLLDVGTGPGWLLLALRRANPSLSLAGVDISPAMIERAGKNIDAAGSGPIELGVASSEQLPFPEGSMDCVVSTLSIHHWKNITAGLMEMHRVLKRGGCALVYDLVQKLPGEIEARNNREFGRFKMLLLWLHSFEEPFYSVEEMAAIADPTPFEKLDVHFTGALCCLALKKK